MSKARLTESEPPPKAGKVDSDPVNDFLSWMGGSVKPLTLSSWKYIFADIERIRVEDRLPSFQEMSIRDIANIKEQIEGRSPSKWYIACYLLRRFFTWLGKENVARQIPIPKYIIIQKKPVWMEEELIPRLVVAADGYQNQAMLQLSYDAALRVSEVTLLDRACVNLEEGTLIVKRLKSKRELIREHEVPISEKACSLLKLYLNERGDEDKEPSLFVRGEMGKQMRTRNYHRLYRKTVQNVFRRALLEARIPEPEDGRPYTFHSLRHSKGTHMAIEGADIIQIAKHLGHVSTNSTLIYIHLAGQALAERQRKLMRAAKEKEAAEEN